MSDQRPIDVQRSATETTGPPERENPRGVPTPGLTQTSPTHTADESESIAAVRQCAALKSRRRKREPLHGDGHGDGDVREPERPEKLSEKQIEAAAEAAEYLLAQGLMPIFNLDTLRAMWRAGHRALVDTLRGGGTR